MKSAIADLLSRFNGNKTSLDVEDELQFHLDMLERKYVQEGMSADDAQAAALRRFGNFQQVKKQCVDISRRSNLPTRVLKTSLVLIGLAGLLIYIGASDFRVARVGHLLITIAIMGRVLLYVRGLSPFTYLAGVKATSITDTSDNTSKLRKA